MLDTSLKFYSVLTYISDLKVKVMDFEILCLTFWLKFLEVNIFWRFGWILLICCVILGIKLLYCTPIVEVKVTDVETLC